MGCVGTKIFFGKSEIRLDSPVKKPPDGQIKGASRSGNYGWATSKPIIITVACISAATLLTALANNRHPHPEMKASPAEAKHKAA